MTTPQTQAIQTANTLIEAAQLSMQLYTLMNTVDQQWNDLPIANTISKFATVALNPDGSLGTPDTTPNTNNPIDISKYQMERAISSFQLSQIKTVMDSFVAMINGQAVSANAGTRAILAVAVGGGSVTAITPSSTTV
jgi:hypothetical protein